MRMRIAFAVAAGLTAGVLTTAGTVTVAGATPAARMASAGPAGGYRPHRCYAGDLAVGFHGSQVGLGNRGFLLTLTNVSGASCRLAGYPGLELRGTADRPQPTRTRRGSTYFSPDRGRQLIVLSPGETASTDISFVTAGSRANSVLAAYLEVSPPGAHRGVVLRIPGGPVLVYRGRVDVTALARHTLYYP